MNTRSISMIDRATLTNALRIAAAQYEADAVSVLIERLREQFIRQAREAREVAERIEEADTFMLTD